MTISHLQGLRGRGLRGRRGGDNQSHRTTLGTQRAFGGHLTTEPENDDEGSVGLNVGAPVFVPGQPVVPDRYVAHEFH